MRRKQSLIAILVGALIASPLAFAKTTDPPGAAPTLVPADTLMVLPSDAPPTYGGLSTVTADADYLAITKPADDANKHLKTIGLIDIDNGATQGMTREVPRSERSTIPASATTTSADNFMGQLIGAPTAAPG